MKSRHLQKKVKLEEDGLPEILAPAPAVYFCRAILTNIVSSFKSVNILHNIRLDVRKAA